MKKVKFIHAADLHLDSPFIGLNYLPEEIFQFVKESTFHSFTRIIDLAIQEKVDFLLIAGDLYDDEDRSLKAQLYFQKQMKRLCEHHIKAYIIHGNHDHTSGRSIQLDLPENVHIFSDKDVECVNYERNGDIIASIYGYSYPVRTVTENIGKRFEKASNAPFHIGLLHGSIASDHSHEPYCPFQLSDLVEKDFDYWALGHIHKRQILHKKSPVILYPGNIQGRHIKEQGSKGVYIVELSEKEVNYQFHPVANIIFQEVPLNIKHIHTLDQLISSIKLVKEKLKSQYVGCFCSLVLEGNTPLYEELHQDGVLEDLQEMMNDEEESHHFVWILSIKNETIPQEGWKEQANIFSGDFQEMIRSYEMDEALQPLYKNHLVRRFIGRFSEEEKEQILDEAKALIFHEWLKSSRD